MATLVEKYFSEIDLDAIKTAIGKVEKTTSGELVVELTSHSKFWGKERLIHALVFALICAVASLFLTRDVNWGVYYDTTQIILWGAIGFVVAFFGWGLFLKRKERRRKVVWNQTLTRFHSLTATRGGTGVLIYMSLEEELAAIAADKGIASKLPDEYWHKPQATLVKAMHEGRHAEGLIETIEMIGVELAEHFPAGPDNINEIPNDPKIVD